MVCKFYTDLFRDKMKMKSKHFLTLSVLLSLLVSCSTGSNNTSQNTQWVYQVDSLIMPFFTTPQAVGNPPGNFPAYRYTNGEPINSSAIDYERLNPDFTPFFLAETDSLRRSYLRTNSRQIYGYCMAYHITGNERYLQLARQGLDYLQQQNAFEKGSAISFWDRNGNPQPTLLARNAQDLAYALLGPAAYYYLTRDQEVLSLILKNHEFVWEHYFENSTLSEQSKLMMWVKEDFERDTVGHKELVAPLDHLNAYMLLMAKIVPDSSKRDFYTRSRELAYSIKDNFYNRELNMFWGNLNSKGLGNHTDFAHSIKTFWMLYTTGRMTGDSELETFAKSGAERLLKTAFIEEDGRWASNFQDLESLALNTSIGTWEFCELDQMAATLSFNNPTFYETYLERTYDYYDRVHFDHQNGNTYLFTDENGKPIDIGIKTGWHISNFHILEHALIGHLSTNNYLQKPVNLYYAFKKDNAIEDEKIQPYHYSADILEKEKLKFDNNHLSDYQKIKVTFSNIR